ncbi:hypothetical protein BSLA_01r3369 [Burkholderia stabilis]|nr:hypothetical protein BSLA_01r3369 [Burkholderia stabilis]
MDTANDTRTLQTTRHTGPANAFLHVAARHPTCSPDNGYP